MQREYSRKRGSNFETISHWDLIRLERGVHNRLTVAHTRLIVESK
jgi:hypothetical protein